VRRAALLERFGDIDKLRRVSAAEIGEVDGFGGKLAAELHAFLHRSAPTTAAATPDETASD
jgi:excinuclease ABC subunit C